MMRIAFVTPEIGTQGATQSCTAAIIERAARLHEVTLYTRSVEGGLAEAQVNLVKIPSLWRPFPALFRYLTFLAFSNLALAWHRLTGRRYDIVHATGGDCFLADVLTAHFCQAERLALALSRKIAVEGKTRLGLLDVVLQWAYMPVVAASEWLMYRRRRVKAVIAVSKGIGRDVRKRYGSHIRVVSIPNGVDLQRFHPQNRALWRQAIRKELGISSETFVLCFVGGDWGRKGLAVAMRALAQLRDEDVALIVLGDGDEKAYRALGHELGIDDRVRFVGRTRVPERYLAAATAFIFPSFFEACSLAALEAAAAGLPLIVTRINGTEELVVDGENGFFIERDPEDIAAKVRALVRDDDLCERMGAAARSTVERGYHWECVARQTFELYEQIAMGRRSDKESS